MELEQRAYHVVNEYSDKETRNNLDVAAKRVIEYLEEIMTGSPADDQLLTVLDNYYLFLESFLERPPHNSKTHALSAVWIFVVIAPYREERG